MILDGHIHINALDADKEKFTSKVSECGLSGGILLSKSPGSYKQNNQQKDWKNRLDDVLRLTEGEDLLFPFFWIDPMSENAKEQVLAACDSGIKGFKVICNYYYPSDEKPMETFKLIARKGKPILFHTGILWDGRPSGRYTRPIEYESLLNVNGLKFAVAHVSWPWYDECIAVYGKFLNAYSSRKDLSVEMFIDTTPGTPEIYRDEVLTKLLTVGYDVMDNIIFGTDSNVSNYNADWLHNWLNIDNAVYKKIGLSEESICKITSENLLRFVGETDSQKTKDIPLSGR